MNKSNLRLLFLDTEGGNYAAQCLVLSKYFAKTYYHIPQYSPFPTPHSDNILTGYESVTRLLDPLSNLDLFDIVVIPDLYLATYQRIFKQLGKLTFGGELDYIEEHRDEFYELQKRLKMPVAPYEVITEFDTFKSLIMQKKYNSYYGKLNYYRGIIETMKYDNYNVAQPLLDKLESEIGPYKNDLTWILQEPIDSKNMIELGMDSYLVNGKIPGIIQIGVEHKDSSYLGKFIDADKAPSQINKVNKAFQPYLDIVKPTNFYSTEIRCDLDTNTNYYNDICARMPQPASLAFLNNCDNIADVIEQGSRGILINPIPKNKYVVELLLKSNWCSTNFLSIEYPEEYIDNVHLKGSFVRDGVKYVTPFKCSGNYNLDLFGSVVVTGNDVDEIITQAMTIADSIKGLEVTYDKDTLFNIQEQIDNMEKKINFKF